MEILQGVWKKHLRPRAVVGCGVKIFLPSPPNYVTRSPGYSSYQNQHAGSFMVSIRGSRAFESNHLEPSYIAVSNSRSPLLEVNREGLLCKATATRCNIVRRTRPNIVIRTLLTMLDTHITLLETCHLSHAT